MLIGLFILEIGISSKNINEKFYKESHLSAERHECITHKT